jgi:hypothetical protein
MRETHNTQALITSLQTRDGSLADNNIDFPIFNFFFDILLLPEVALLPESSQLPVRPQASSRHAKHVESLVGQTVSRLTTSNEHCQLQILPN